jgi:FecR protein
MNEPEHLSGPLKDLIDDYLSGRLDEARTAELEERLRADADARRYFVRYARLHTDLHLEMRARQASDRALNRLFPQPPEAGRPEAPSGSRAPSLRRRVAPRAAVAAAGLLLAAGALGWFVQGHRDPVAGADPAIAWLVNAQNCFWSGQEPTGDMRAGKVLKLERGLAAICFECGARVVLEGPASLELLSAHSARLRHGKLTARVPEAAAGFTILSPQGKVIDLGTEFGIAVSEDGAARVYVFEGKVEARPTADGRAGGVSLSQNQAARIAAGKVTVEPAGPEAGADQFVRAIVPPPVIAPHTLRLTFDRPAAGGIRDAGGRATGLTHRLPGTGAKLADDDANLRLDPARGRLELTTTNSDLNTQYRLHHGEYLGVRLANLGFTGREDFAVSVTLANIPALESVGQFGLYAGPRSDRNIRGGLISSRRLGPGQYTQFLVNNDGGHDADTCRVGLFATGSDLRLTLKRTGGKYALTVENLTEGSASTLTIRHPEFLDGERDLYVGLFGANTQSEVRRTLTIKEFAATVWTVAPAAGAD